MSELEYVPADAFTRQFSNIYKEDDMEIKRFSEEVKTAARIAAERPHAHRPWINAVTPILEEAAAKMYAPKPEPVKVGDKVKILNNKCGAPNGTVGRIGEVCGVLGGVGLRVKFANGERWYYERREVELLTNVDWRARAERAEARLEAMRAAMETYMRTHSPSEVSYQVIAELSQVGGFTIQPAVIHPAPPIEPLCVLDQAA
jgi:hypothetical protein